MACKTSVLEKINSRDQIDTKSKEVINHIFKNELTKNEIIKIKKWAQRSRNKGETAFKHLLELSKNKQIPQFPIALKSASRKKSGSGNAEINQERDLIERLNGKLEILKKKCEKNESSQLDGQNISLEEIPLIQKLNNEELWSEAQDDLLTAIRFAQARRCLDESALILKSFFVNPDSEMYGEYVFRQIWQFHLLGNIKNAYSFVTSIDYLSSINTLGGKTLFWLAAVLEANDKKREATQLHKEIVRTSPLEYYGILSGKKIKGIDAEHDNFHHQQFSTNVYNDINQFDPNDDLKNIFSKIIVWSEVKSEILVSLEIKKLNLKNVSTYFNKKSIQSDKSLESSLKNSIIHSVAKILSSSSMDLEAFKFLQYASTKFEFPIDRRNLEIIFPIKYKEHIWSHSHKNDLDPIFTLGLIRQESAFNPYARSHVGARGLMQIMPRTAQTLQRNISTKDLFDPATNILLGTKYLKRLNDKFDNNLVLVLAAYNAGDHRVSTWLKDIFQKDDELLTVIENIPFTETNWYVKLIYRNIFFYKMLYGEQTDSSLLTKIYDLNLGPTVL